MAPKKEYRLQVLVEIRERAKEDAERCFVHFQSGIVGQLLQILEGRHALPLLGDGLTNLLLHFLEWNLTDGLHSENGVSVGLLNRPDELSDVGGKHLTSQYIVAEIQAAQPSQVAALGGGLRIVAQFHGDFGESLPIAKPSDDLCRILWRTQKNSTNPTMLTDVVLVEALACDSERAIVPIGSSTIAAAANAWGTPVWLVAAVGRRLPTGFIDHMVSRYEEITDPDGEHPVDPWEMDVEILPTSMVTDVVGPHGHVPMGPPAIRPDCPMAHELLRRSPM